MGLLHPLLPQVLLGHGLLLLRICLGLHPDRLALAHLGQHLLQLLQLGLQQLQPVAQLLHAGFEPLGDGALVVAQNGHLAVGAIVHELLLRGGDGRLDLLHAEAQLLLQGHRCVVRTEHLGAEAGHERGQVLVEHVHSELVEHVRRLVLALAEALQVLQHLHSHLAVHTQIDHLVVAHRVLAQEVELDAVVVGELDVLHAQRAAAHRVRLIIILLVANTQSELVNHPHRSG
mmetsp:Transcript_1037/g.3046  ORF Transcript_1037/g.3046 Transcript_1037/m.3046 type:complete len:231 (+) Transcript_1037:1000-1692(+)